MVIILDLILMDKTKLAVFILRCGNYKVQIKCSHLTHGLSSLTSFPLSSVFLYAAGDKETIVKQTSTDIVLLAVCMSFGC